MHSEWVGGSGNNVAAILLKTFGYTHIFIRRCSIALNLLIRLFVCVFCVYLLRSMEMIAPQSIQAR